MVDHVDDLLYGRSDLGRLAERAERFGLRLAHDHAVAVAVGPKTYGDTHPVTRRVERAMIARFGDRRIILLRAAVRRTALGGGGTRRRRHPEAARRTTTGSACY